MNSRLIIHYLLNQLSVVHPTLSLHKIYILIMFCLYGKADLPNIEQEKYKLSKYKEVKVKLGPHYKDKFPAKLYGIIEKTKFSPIIAWFLHGYSWKMLKNKR